MDEQQEKEPKNKGKASPGQSSGKQVSPPEPPESSQQNAAEPEPGEGFDFGGLPARNLKKNLGCGG